MGSAATSLKLLKVFDPNELANAQGGGGNCFLSPIQPQGRCRCTEVRGAHVTSKFPRFISPENLQAQSFCHLDFGSIVPFTPWSIGHWPSWQIKVIIFRCFWCLWGLLPKKNVWLPHLPSLFSSFIIPMNSTLCNCNWYQRVGIICSRAEIQMETDESYLNSSAFQPKGDRNLMWF